MSDIYSFRQLFSQMSSTQNSRYNEETEETEETEKSEEKSNCEVFEVKATDGTHLISVSELPQRYRNVFINRFPYFNCVQSKVFEDVFHSNKSIVLCAPTSSGKTVVLELAIIKKMKDLEDSNEELNCLKCVYMAPLKKLVDEKFNEFKSSFERFGLKCIQFTGDSDMEDYSELMNANIVLTTPEKWDSMVRANQNNALIRSIQVMLIDEIHSIGDDQRGATMEAVISRMRTLRSVQIKTSGADKIRFIAVSATAPNVDDIAQWLESTDSIGYNFSESYRPVRIQTIVYGYNCSKDVSDFKFDINLNYRLDSVIKSHCDSKPALIFCSTRKSVEMTAKTLFNFGKNYFNTWKQKSLLETNLRKCDIKDKKLKTYIRGGIAYHHSGLDRRDKQTIEGLFTDSLLPILISTTTLSMGVNLPAHLVIIKNTTQFECNGVVREYPETLIMQMIGRAGRPQFDKTAIAVIMTKNEKRTKYELLSNGTQIVESKLHKHLTEHLNAEIALRTVTSIDIAVDWIRSTFLYIRLLKNSKIYSNSIPINNIEQGLQIGREWCHNELTKLRNNEMIVTDDSFSQISSTALGRFMARNYISFETMKKFCQIIAQNLELKDIIEKISKCEELTQEIQIRVSDKKILNELNQKHIRFPIDGKIKSSDMKINCLIQTTFDSEVSNINDNTLIQESIRIIRTAQRLSKCLSDIIYFKTEQNQSKIHLNTLLNVLILSKCFKAKLWPDSKQITKQFNRIGDRISKKISDKFGSFKQLREGNPRDIEFRAERKAPFGTQLIDWVKRLPFYSLKISQTKELKRKESTIRIRIKIENFSELEVLKPLYKNHSFFLVVGDETNQLFYCQQLFDLKLLKNNGYYETKDIIIERNDRSGYVCAKLISDSLVGLDVECRLSLVFAADTNVTTPELIATNNCSIAFSGDSCELNSRSDPNESCQHKCLNKMSCLHKCCKKSLNPEKNKTQKQTTKNKKQSNEEQNNSKKLKSNKNSTQTNLMDWIQKLPKNNTNVNTETKTQTNVRIVNHNFDKKYSEIEDIPNEDYFQFSDFSFDDNNCDKIVNNFNDINDVNDVNDVKEDDIFDEEFDKMFEENDFISEDFQEFYPKNNDFIVGTTTDCQICEYSPTNEPFSEFSPTKQIEGKKFFFYKRFN